MTEEARRPAFRFLDNVGLQYHFFAGGMAFSIRLVHRLDVCTHAAWIFDGSMREIAKSNQVWTQSDSEYLDISSDIMAVRDEDGDIVVSVKSSSGEDDFEARVRPVHTLTSNDTFNTASNDDVLHLPDLNGTLEYKGQSYSAFGYCKHVEWNKGPRYTGYRFLHGVLDDDKTAIWSADAVFGYKKYDYFKMVEPDGTIVVADDELSSHKQKTIYASIGDRHVRVVFEELGAWELPLIDPPETDMVIQQRYGTITYHEGNVKKSGTALTEYGFGKFAEADLS